MANKPKPLSPQAMARKRKKKIPGVVFQVFNQLIAEYYDGDSASFEQKLIIKQLKKKGLNEGEIFEQNWLCVEPYYRAVGWKVEYCQPTYPECFDEYFVFTPKRR